MVDRIARDKYAELIRHYASGRITYGEYDEQAGDLAWSTHDASVSSVYDSLDWIRNEFGRDGAGSSPSIGAKRRVSQAILFLYSNDEYGWPYKWYGVADLFLMLFGVLGVALLAGHEWLWGLGCTAVALTDIPRFRWWWSRKYRLYGDTEAWPFRHKADLEEARRHPRLLNGR